MTLIADLGRTVRQHRERAGLTQQEVGEAIGRTTQTIGNIERGQSLPTLQTLEAIARTLKTPMREFFPAGGAHGNDVASRIAAHLSILSARECEWIEAVLVAVLRRPGP